MRSRLFKLFAIALLICCTPWPVKGAKRQPIPPSAASPASSAPSSSSTSGLEVNAEAAVLMEVSTGTILFEHNADKIIEPASFTKVLTLYLVFENLEKGVIHLNDEVFVSERAWRTGGSKMFVGVGSKVPLEELIKGIAVVSGNDACLAVAEQLYGSEESFVSAMNQKAKELGMKNSEFRNPHGLPDDKQVTTARDMAILDGAYLKRFPNSLKYHSMREYTYNGITQYNRNHLLLKDATVDGLKTGYVAAAGYHLSATAERDGMRLLAVVMGAKTPGIREREALNLLNYGFRNFTLIQPFPKDKPVATVKVWKGVEDSLNLYPSEEAALLVSQREKNAIRWEIDAPTEVNAPITAQQTLGKIVFFVSDQAKKSVPLVSEKDIAQAGFFKRLWHSIAHIRLPDVSWQWLSGISGGIFAVALLVVLVMNRRSTRRSRNFKK